MHKYHRRIDTEWVGIFARINNVSLLRDPIIVDEQRFTATYLGPDSQKNLGENPKFTLGFS